MFYNIDFDNFSEGNEINKLFNLIFTTQYNIVAEMKDCSNF